VKKPNVLFLISDQHNAKCLGHAGHPIVKTPNLDRLAAEGVRFTNAITQNPICTPSRVCYFSGQYPHNHGYYGLVGQAPLALPTILGHFRAHGYRTAAVGKIHCPLDWIPADADYHREVDAHPKSDGSQTKSDYDRYLEAKGLLAQRDDGLYPEQTERGRTSKDARRSALNYEDSVEGWCAREGMKFIEESGDSSWIMQLSFPRPHQIYSPSDPFWEMYPDNLPMPPNADIDMSLKPPHMRKMREMHVAGQGLPLFGDKSYEALRRRKLRGYYGLVSQTDHAIGQVLDLLRVRGLEEDTIVIYTSDHGEYACEFGLLEKAPGICSDAVTRIPHIWRWPKKFKRGHVCEQLVETVDLATTITALAGLPEFITGDGKDISPLLQGEEVELHQVSVTENAWSKSIRKGPWRMVYYPRELFAEESPDRPVGELYNIKEDPWEMNNLFYDPEHQKKIRELRADLMDWLTTTTRVATGWPPIPSDDPHLEHRRDADGKASPEGLRQLARKGEKYYL